MNAQNMAKGLTIILLFGLIGSGIGILEWIDRLHFTGEFFWKIVFLLIIIPLILSVVILSIRFALLYPVSNIKTVNINSKNIKQVNIPMEGNVNNNKIEIKDIDIETLATNWIKNAGRYGFLQNDFTVMDAILYHILDKTGVKLDRVRLLNVLTKSENYSVIKNEVVNKKEWEDNKKEIARLQDEYNADPMWLKMKVS